MSRLENFTVRLKIWPHVTLKYGPEVQWDRQHHFAAAPAVNRRCSVLLDAKCRRPFSSCRVPCAMGLSLLCPTQCGVGQDRTEKNMRVFPWGAELCQKAGSHHTGSRRGARDKYLVLADILRQFRARSRQRASTPFRDVCFQPFRLGKRSSCSTHAYEHPQLSRWQCDATAELRGSAEAQAIDKGHAPTSHGNRVRDSAAPPEKHTVSAKTTTKRLGAFFGILRTAWRTQNLQKKRFLQRRPTGQWVQCPALQPSRSPSAPRR